MSIDIKENRPENTFSSSPERPDSFECSNTSRMDLPNLIAPEQALDIGQKPRPAFWYIMRDYSLESIGELHGDTPRWGRCEEAQDMCAEGFAV